MQTARCIDCRTPIRIPPMTRCVSCEVEHEDRAGLYDGVEPLPGQPITPGRPVRGRIHRRQRANDPGPHRAKRFGGHELALGPSHERRPAPSSRFTVSAESYAKRDPDGTLQASFAEFSSASPCIDCGKPSKKQRCHSCHKKHAAQYQRDRKAKLQAEGLCCKCGKASVADSQFKTCSACRDLDNVRQRTPEARAKERQRRRQRPRQRDLKPEYRAHKKELDRQRYLECKAEGRCVTCQLMPARPGKTQCDRCTQRAKYARARLRAKEAARAES